VIAAMSGIPRGKNLENISPINSKKNLAYIRVLGE